jgi:hypothetical protein
LENKSVVADGSNEVGGWDDWLEVDDWFDKLDILLVLVMTEISGNDAALTYYAIENI